MGLLRSIQEACKAALQADDFFFDVPIVAPDTGIKEGDRQFNTIQDQIDAAIAAKGIVLVLVTAEARCLPNTPGPVCKPLIYGRVLEDTLANRSAGGTGKRAVDVAEHGLVRLHRLVPSEEDQIILLATEDGVQLGDDPDRLSYDFSLRGSGQLGADLEALEIPDIPSMNVRFRNGRLQMKNDSTGLWHDLRLQDVADTPTLYPAEEGQE